MLLAQIRAQALAWKRSAAPRDEAERVDDQPRDASGAPQDWLGQVALAVAGIDAEDPQRHRKAFRIYLQAVLAREWGIRHVEAPGFQQLVDQVRDTMESDPRLRDAMRTAGDALLDPAAR